jgi:hypothetical protein
MTLAPLSNKRLVRDLVTEIAPPPSVRDDDRLPPLVVAQSPLARAMHRPTAEQRFETRD